MFEAIKKNESRMKRKKGEKWQRIGNELTKKKNHPAEMELI